MIPESFFFWVRGTGFQIAVALFVGGMVFRMAALALMARRKSLAEPRGSEWGPGLRMIWRRSFVLPQLGFRGKLTFVSGYLFHLGLLLVVLFLSQHILLLRSVLGFGWPSLPRGVIDVAAVLAMAALVVLLVHRFTDPVKRLLSDFQDYLSWTVTCLPLLTGFLLSRNAGFDYRTLLTVHLLTVELLLVVMPFTKLAHMFSTFGARWYNGAIAGLKGVLP